MFSLLFAIFRFMTRIMTRCSKNGLNTGRSDRTRTCLEVFLANGLTMRFLLNKWLNYAI